MRTLSKYTRVYYDIDEDIVLYNTINRNVISLPRAYFHDRNNLIDDISKDELSELNECGFFVEEINFKILEKQYEAVDALIIRLETILCCNLRCPYC